MSEYRDDLIKEIIEEIELQELCCDGCKSIIPSDCFDCPVESCVSHLKMQLDSLLYN